MGPCLNCRQFACPAAPVHGARAAVKCCNEPFVELPIENLAARYASLLPQPPQIVVCNLGSGVVKSGSVHLFQATAHTSFRPKELIFSPLSNVKHLDFDTFKIGKDYVGGVITNQFGPLRALKGVTFPSLVYAGTPMCLSVSNMNDKDVRLSVSIKGILA